MTGGGPVRERAVAPAGVGADRTCRGWMLVTARRRLSPREREAAEAHLRLCRRCRRQLDPAAGPPRIGAAAGAATVGGVARLLARLFAASGVGSSATPFGSLPVLGAVAGGAITAGGAGLLLATHHPRVLSGADAVVRRAGAVATAGPAASRPPRGGTPATAAAGSDAAGATGRGPVDSRAGGRPPLPVSAPPSSPPVAPESLPTTVPPPGAAPTQLPPLPTTLLSPPPTSTSPPGPGLPAAPASLGPPAAPAAVPAALPRVAAAPP